MAAATLANDRKNKRLVIAALEDYYDEPGANYRPGHSDETLAKELNLAPKFVITVREELFGPIGPPAEFVAFVDMAKEIDARTRKLNEDIRALRDQITAAATRNGWKL